MAIVVTATASGSGVGIGMILRVRCVVGADSLANIAAGTGKGTQSGAAAHTVALTTTRIGSVVWTAIENGNNGANNPSSGNSSLDDVPDASNLQQYGTIFQTTPTVTPGAFTAGSVDSFNGSAAALEILPVVSGGTITYDSSGPALAQTFTASTVSTASFTPPPGALLMALVPSSGGLGVVNMTVSDTSGLTWTEVVAGHATSEQYAGIWLAQVPGASSSVAPLVNPGSTWRRRFRHIQIPLPPPPPEVDVAVTGVVSDTQIASPVGTVGIGAIGVVSDTVSASPVGSVTGSAGVVGAAPNTVTSASPVGTVSGSAAVVGVVSNVTSASPVGTVGTGAIGVVSNTTSASPVGTAKIAVTGVVSNTVSASPVGTVSGSAVVVGVVSNVTSASPVGKATINKIGVAPNTVTSASPVGHVTGSAGVIGAAPNTVLSASPVGTVTAITPRTPEQFSALITDANLLGATVTNANQHGANVVAGPWSGTVSRFTLDATAVVVDPLYGATVVDANLLGGTVTDANLFGGTGIGFTMQAQNITLGEFNDELLNITVLQSGSAFNLTGFTLKAYLKTAAGVSDTDPSTITLSSTGGSPAITVISAPAGTIQIRIPRADLSAPGIGFWRLDVIDGSSNQNTVVQGTVTLTLL